MTDKTPERIGAVKLKGAKHVTYLGGDDCPHFDPTEYVRADLVEDLTDETITALSTRIQALEADRDALLEAAIDIIREQWWSGGGISAAAKDVMLGRLEALQEKK